MLGEFTNFPERPREVVVLRQATPSWLGALAPRITNATRRLEREPSTLGVEAQDGKLSCELVANLSRNH